MNINHRPTLDVELAEQIYTEKDGVPINYVCTTSLKGYPENISFNIFFRDTPHPEFGNYYFGLGVLNGGWRIVNADSVEDLEFDCVEGENGYEYSRHVHDYNPAGYAAIDGGRSYTRLTYSEGYPGVKTFKVISGECLEVKEEEHFE